MKRLASVCLVFLLLWIGRASGEESYIGYSVEIEAPNRLAGVLRADLDLVRWQGHETMTPELLERLVREARTEALEILAAQGYFSPSIEARIEGEGAERVVRIQVEPGPPTRVRSVQFRVTGPASQGDAIDRASIARTEAEWKLAAGETFTQGAWDDAKRAALESLSRRRYLLARISESEARIDPASQSAHLRVTIDSGPVIAFGELEIAGLDKYDPALVRNLWTFAPGADYDRELLERFQRRATAVEYFDSVLVDADPARVDNGRVPVRVTLHEAPDKRIQLGANFSTDSGIGGSIGYQNRNFLNRAWRLGTRLDLQQRLQTADATIGLPERPGGWADQYALRLRHTEIENLDTREASIGWRRSSIEERRQPHYGITLAFSEQRADRVLDESVHATYLYYGYTWRTTDDLLAPRRGTIAQVEAGIAPPGVSTRGFGRAIGRLAWYHPLGPARDLLVQVQGGAVMASSSNGIPQQFLFRTGGSTTVRGYDLDSLGVERGNAVLGGRAFALATIEATQWLTDTIGIAVFLDAGNAADRLRDLRPAYGIGAGARVRTPLGPFRLDLAYGEERKSWRLHFSIGLSF